MYETEDEANQDEDIADVNIEEVGASLDEE